VTITDAHVAEPSLENLFLHLTGTEFERVNVDCRF
jgi:hypothetical protein